LDFDVRKHGFGIFELKLLQARFALRTREGLNSIPFHYEFGKFIPRENSHSSGKVWPSSDIEESFTVYLQPGQTNVFE
jgi:hypothetical protein